VSGRAEQIARMRFPRRPRLTLAVRRGTAGAGGGEEGSSLIELLVVLAVLALVAAIALPGAPTPAQRPSLRLVAADMATRLRAARSMAIAQQREVAFAFDSGTRTYGVDGVAAPRAVPAAVEVSVTTARQYVRDAGEARLVFYSDGTSSGGTIRLADQRQQVVIGVAWLTGAVHVDRNAP
jgi:general secretion pathway protein H